MKNETKIGMYASDDYYDLCSKIQVWIKNYNIEIISLSHAICQRDSLVYGDSQTHYFTVVYKEPKVYK